jgi:hypothetical protein
MKERETGYSWRFFYTRRAFVSGLVVMLLVIGVSGAFSWWYSHYGEDPTPGGNVGLSYGLMGLTFLVLAGTLYSIRRHFQHNAVGQLNRALNWHVFFALIGLALLLMHSFGTFNANSGTYALASLIALTMSGLLGRTLDRLLAWRIAVEVDRALTAEGEDRVEAIVQEIQRSIVAHKRHETQHFTPRSSELQSPPAPTVPLTETGLLPEHWSTLPLDLAYTSLEKTPLQWSRERQDHGFLLDGESPLVRPGAVAPDEQEQLAALQAVQRALRREALYRSVIHSWRVLHIALALLTLGLTIWHLVYALQLLLPGMLMRF